MATGGEVERRRLGPENTHTSAANLDPNVRSQAKQSGAMANEPHAGATGRNARGQRWTQQSIPPAARALFSRPALPNGSIPQAQCVMEIFLVATCLKWKGKGKIMLLLYNRVYPKILSLQNTSQYFCNNNSRDTLHFFFTY